MSEKSIAVQQPPRFRTPQTQTEAQAFELLQEVRNLFDQYRREVPGKRKPWSESIKKRILALWALGISSHRIGSETDVPIQTLYSWRQRIKKQKSSTGFSEIPVVGRRRRTTFQIQQDEERRRSMPNVHFIHEYGHTIQFIAINAIVGAGGGDNNDVWRATIISGAFGLATDKFSRVMPKNSVAEAIFAAPEKGISWLGKVFY